MKTTSIKNGEKKLTRVSIFIVWLFLFCHMWKIFPTAYEAYKSDNGLDHDDWPYFVIVLEHISHSLVTFNSAINFVIYFILKNRWSKSLMLKIGIEKIILWDSFEHLKSPNILTKNGTANPLLHLSPLMVRMFNITHCISVSYQLSLSLVVKLNLSWNKCFQKTRKKFEKGK